MIKNQIKYSFRAFKKQKTYVFINVLGLAIGLACSLIILLFIGYELSYDQYNEKKEDIYRVILNGKIGGQEVTVTSTASPIGPTMRNEFPEVKDFLRMNGWGTSIIRYNDKNFSTKHCLEADSSFFNFFSIELLQGNKDLVLNEPYSLVLSKTTAEKIFGDEDPINKMIKVDNDTSYYRITGIFEDIPPTTHFEANAIRSFMTNPRSVDNQWLSNSFTTFVLLHSNTDPEKVNERFSAMVEKYVGPEVLRYFGISIQEFLKQGNKYNMFLQNLADIHLDPGIEQDFKSANDPRYLWIFGSIAILILVIAAINFMNLSTAQASKRAKEVGIKKVSGSTKGSLISQFLLETIILSLFALLLTILITEISLPYFNNLLGLKLNVDYFGNWYTIPGMIIFSATVGLIAGSYPAFYLSSFSPYMVLKGMRTSSRGKGRLRSVLVVLQFSISIVLIVGTLIMFRQISFMLNKDLGFDKEQILVVTGASTIGKKVKSFKEDVKAIPGVLNIATSTAIPGHNNNNNGYMIKGRPEDSYLMFTNWVDYDYIDTYGIKLESGRFFNPLNSLDKEACIVNQNAAKSFLMEDPFAIRFVEHDEGDPEKETYMPIIGVAADFHHESLRSGIAPYIMRFKDEDINWGYISIKLAPTTPLAVLEDIEQVWKSYANNDPMQSYFMDEDFERMYKEEKQNAHLSILFAILGIFIASLGLYGLTSFTIQQKTKEIGVRKTFGATMQNIWMLIAREIMILVGISAAIAFPFIFWIANNWLQNYHYRIDLKATDFIVGFFIALFIALVTISYRTIKTSLVNPAESLRYE